jgi:hypothetical protein
MFLFWNNSLNSSSWRGVAFFGQLHTSFISDLLDRSEMHRLVRAFDLLPGR